MATIKQEASIAFQAHLILSETEARALEAMVSYGTDEFINVFYRHLGETYMKPHQEGLRSLFQSVRDTIPGQLHTLDLTRDILTSRGRCLPQPPDGFEWDTGGWMGPTKSAPWPHLKSIAKKEENESKLQRRRR